MFKDHVYIGTSDEIQNFDIIMSYKEYFNHYNPFVSSYIPSKLSSGFTFRNKSIDIDYFDNIYSTRLNDLYLSPKIILPKINFLETYIQRFGKTPTELELVTFKNETSLQVTTQAVNFRDSKGVVIESTKFFVFDGPNSFDFLINKMFWAGMAYRSNSALAVIFGFQVNKQLLASYSFDYGLNKIQTYSQGTHEIVLNYLFSYKGKNVVTPRYF